MSAIGLLRIIYFLPKRLWLKLRYGSRVSFGRREQISPFAPIIVTDSQSKINISDFARIESHSVLKASSGNIAIGKSVYINRNSMIVSKTSIEIGDDVTIGPGVYIYDHDHDMHHRGSYVTSPVIIGKKTWIGAGTIILKGVTIGCNCVIAAGSVVSRNVEDNQVFVQKRQSEIKPIQR